MPDDAEKSKYIPMYYSYIEQLGLLSLEQVGALVMALLVYGRDGTQPDFPKDGNVYMAFSFIADNSMRAEIRRQEIVEKRREAGRIRAASAEKDESGRFVQQKASKKPALSSKSSTDQQIQLYKDKDNNKDNNNNNRRIRAHAHAYANDDGFDDGWSEREREIVAFCREVVKDIKSEQERKVLAAADGMELGMVLDAISIAYEKGCSSPDYIVSSIESQRHQPDRRPGKI